jgi:hypothetical protein
VEFCKQFDCLTRKFMKMPRLSSADCCFCAVWEFAMTTGMKEMKLAICLIESRRSKKEASENCVTDAAVFVGVSYCIFF